MSPTAHPPSFIPFVLTAENGTKTFCCCLVCYQPQTKEMEQAEWCLVLIYHTGCYGPSIVHVFAVVLLL